ncbi:CHAT domain-containing protein [Streptomyces sp. NPDC006458]|uniref:CHAT domain-containing protein n=1 Tax=Streptomyces sp. NPDC006458 TaxID=3154302 RepID=UPI0033B8C126
MGDRDELLAGLRGLIDTVVQRQDGTVLYTPAAERAAAALAAATDPAADPEAAYVLGWFHWLRFETSDEEDERAELVEGVRLLAPVYDAAPETMPDLLHLILKGGPRDGVTGEAALELGLAVTLAYEHGRHFPLLNRAVTLFRSAVAGPFENPLDRAMALNNLGHALRMLHEQGAGDGELDEAVAVTRQAVAVTGHPEHVMFRSNLGVALLLLHFRDKDVAHLEEAVALARAAVAAAPPEDPNLTRYRNNLGVALHTLADERDDPRVGEEGLALTRAVLEVLPDGPARLAQLHILSMALRTQYERVREAGLLDDAVAAARAAVAGTPEGNPARPERLDKLVVCLILLFQRTGDLTVLAEAVTAARSAARAPVAPQRPRYQANLTECLRLTAEHSIDPAAAHEAVAAARAALAAGSDDVVTHKNRVGALGTALHTLYLYTSDLDHLTEAVARAREALAALPAGDPDRLRELSNLGFGLRTLYEAVGSDELLDEAIEVTRRALAAMPRSHRMRPGVLTNLASILIRKHERVDSVTHAHEAVALARDAVAATPPGHPDRPSWQNNLVLALYDIGTRLGLPDRLREAIAVCHEALSALPERHPRRSVLLNNLANSQVALFELTGDLALLRESAATARAAVDATPEGHPHRGMHLNGLGRILQHLTWNTGDSAPLAEAIAACRAAVAAAPPGPMRQMFLGNLGAALDLAFRRQGRREDIAEAVEICRATVAALASDHPLRVVHLHSLTTALLAHALLGDGGPDGVDEAVDCSREALAGRPADHPDRVRALADLAHALRARHLVRDDPAPLAEAVAVTREAVRLLPPGAPVRPGLLHDHAVTLHLLHEQTGDAALVPEILAASREAAADSSAPITVRVAAYRRTAVLLGQARGSGGQGNTIAAGNGRPRADADDPVAEALAAVEAAVALLPQLGLNGLDLGDQGHQIGEAGSLASAAAAAALDAGLPGRAVELLEQSRGVLTADSATDGGAEGDRLRATVPELADLFEEVRSRREALNRPVPPPTDTPQPYDVRAAARREAQTEWEAVLARIRSLDGFAGFLAPPSAARLTAESAEGTVVYVSAAPTRCDALVLTGDPAEPVRVVPLGITERDVLARIRTLGGAIDRAADRDVGLDDRQTAQHDILGVLDWLWDTVGEPVLTALGRTGPPAPGEPWPRVWWCPVGLMAYLPLHAAGHHADLAAAPEAPRAVEPAEPDTAPPRTVLDRVVSSYTATVRGLARARRHRRRGAAAPAARPAVVAVPEAPGVVGLPGALAEADLLAGLLPGADVLPHPTRASVLAALPGHPVAHFACHGAPHRIDPWRGRLILHDHDTDPLTVADIGALRLDGGLAFLSACNTTLAPSRLADEALHITGAFQLAGYPHVVGTLWPVSDRAAHQLAADFYTRLTGSGATPPDPLRSADSLHHATRGLRARYPRTPTLWAAHTHTGA